jgi:hypothetical protein
MRKPACFEDHETSHIIRQLCEENNIDMQLIIDICAEVDKFSGSGRKDGLQNDILSCINEFIDRNTINSKKI